MFAGRRSGKGKIFGGRKLRIQPSVTSFCSQGSCDALFLATKKLEESSKKNDKMGMKKILLSFEWNAVDACFLFSPYRIGKSASEIFDLILLFFFVCLFCFVFFYEDYHDLVFCFEK